MNAAPLLVKTAHHVKMMLQGFNACVQLDLKGHYARLTMMNVHRRRADTGPHAQIPWQPTAVRAHLVTPGTIATRT